MTAFLGGSIVKMSDCSFSCMCIECIITLLHQELEEELHNARQQLSSSQSHSSSLADQLSSREKEVAAKETQLTHLW